MADSPYIVEITAQNFQQVVEASHKVPILVDFWAEWCQPCKMLMPILAKLVDEYQGRFYLAKLNTEQEQALAAQFGIRSIPTVKLFINGEAVDEFAGALPEAEIRKFLDRNIPRPSDGAVAAAQQLLEAGDSEQATQLLTETLNADPDNHRVRIALAQTHASAGNSAMAKEVLDTLPEDQLDNPEVASLRAQLQFSAGSEGIADAAELEARLAADENDSEARYQLAVHRINTREYEAALELLLELMRRDRQYEDDGARKTMIQIFEMLGSGNPLVPRYRSKMMNLIY